MSVAVSDPFPVEIERFHGPLDLLLHLIRNQDLDIFDIPIAQITQQFLAIVTRTERLELERAGEFLEMAATLVRIKAQMLFPRSSQEETEDPRAELVRRLLEYEHFRGAAERLAAAERERARQRGKGYLAIRPHARLDEAPLETSWDEFLAATRALARRTEAEPPGYRFVSAPVRLEEKVELILAALARLGRVEFSTLVAPWGTRSHAIVALLACLELAKQHTVELRQGEPFAPLWVHRASRPS